jgi:hypothetical protein
MLRHGVQREVFICELAANAAALLRSGKGRPNIDALLRASEVAELAIQRWVLPRSARRPEYRAWTKSDVKALLTERRRPFTLVHSESTAEKA